MTITVPHNVKYWVILPAAGVGKRMSIDKPKQYLLINPTIQQTIIEHTVSLFVRHPRFEKVVVVLQQDDTEWPKQTIAHEHSEKIMTTTGDVVRARSVFRGLAALASLAKDKDWVLVHDVVRTCLFPEVLDCFIQTIAEHGVGGLLAMPIRDTVKKVNATNHCVDKTISREGLWVAQTPQMFRYGLLFEAMQKALALNAVLTDEASAVELVGECPLVVKGDWRNIKITTSDDLEYAKQLLKIYNG